MTGIRVDDSLKAFIEAKEKYNNMRNAERKKIGEFLDSNKERLNLEEVYYKGNAGRGRTDYTSGKRLNPPYDLSNWMYVEAKTSDLEIFISLQTFDIDPCSRNLHVLFDRIGVSVYKKVNAKRRDTFSRILEMKTTPIELPMNESKFSELIDEINIRVAEVRSQIQI